VCALRRLFLWSFPVLAGPSLREPSRPTNISLKKPSAIRAEEMRTAQQPLVEQDRSFLSRTAPPQSGMSGERRIITALFCDVVDSTAMAEHLDPEDWADVMNRAFELITAPVDRYDGTVARLMGDAALAFFGAPVAHEEDPVRAVLAGLEILGGLDEFREEIRDAYGLDFNVRVGISTGPVVVGDVGSAVAMEYTAMGDAVNVASRMEQAAEAGTLLISGETHRLIAPLFDVEPLGELDVKGKSEAVAAFRVLRAREEPGRVRGVGSLNAPLIGRDREFEILKEALAKVRAGRGQIISLIGAAGLGKSRLLEEARAEWLRDNPPDTWEQSQGSPYDSDRPYALFQAFARDLFDIGLNDPPEVIHEKVDTGLRAGNASEEAIALCSVALERIIAAKVLHDAPDYPADVIKQDIYEIVYPAWRAYASRAPAVMVVDDLHWSDQASVDLLTHLFGLVDQVPILFLCALRPERQSPGWQVKLKAETDYPHRYREINLRPLEEEETDRLVGALLEIADLPGDLRHLVLRKTEGNPYFVEEVVRSLIEQGVVSRTEDGLRWTAAKRVQDISIPDTLQALLMARMDRLDREARETLQLASVIGRSFYHRVLKAISDSAIALDEHLSVLERVELVREASRDPELEYAFKHELTRDAAYNSILRRRRRELHEQVGRAMETLFADRLEENAHRLARHFAAAGDAKRALDYHIMAAEAAAAMSANADAAIHYDGAVEAADRLGMDPQEIGRLRDRRAALVGSA
jgi:class 3 adenylate cyclase